MGRVEAFWALVLFSFTLDFGLWMLRIFEFGFCIIRCLNNGLLVDFECWIFGCFVVDFHERCIMLPEDLFLYFGQLKPWGGCAPLCWDHTSRRDVDYTLTQSDTLVYVTVNDPGEQRDIYCGVPWAMGFMVAGIAASGFTEFHFPPRYSLITWTWWNYMAWGLYDTAWSLI